MEICVCARAEIIFKHVIATIFQPGERSEISARAEIHHVIRPLDKLGHLYTHVLNGLGYWSAAGLCFPVNIQYCFFHSFL